MTTPTPTTRRGPRCHCGTAIPYTPGKGRPRTYCSDRCKQRAKRALREGPRISGSLGKKTTEFRAPSDLRRSDGGAGATPDTDRRDAPNPTAARKARRYANRRVLWQVTTDAACKGCGRQAMDPDAGVIVAQTAAGTSAVLGLMRCGRIWLCPVCAATIRHRRSEEITTGVVEWLNRGGQAYLVTFTARHAATHRLADLMDAIQGTRADQATGTKRRPGAYQRLITGAAWAGDSRRAGNADGIRGRIGYVGMIRATEVTLGQSAGWHPHIHAIVLVGGRTEGKGADRQVTGTFEVGADALNEWQDRWRATWTRHLAQVDPDFTPSDEHGVDFKPLTTAQDAEDLGKYIAKTQDGKLPGLELARADLKGARAGNMTPFELLGRIGDLTGGVPEDDVPGHGSLTWCLDRWREYEAATSGRRAIEWTRHLRALLGLQGGDAQEDDLDLLAEATAEHEYRGGVTVTEPGWSAVTRRGLDLAVIQAGEGDDANTDPGAMTSRVREVVEMAGAIGAVRQLGPAEVAEAYEQLLASLAQRREDAAERRRRERQQHEGVGE